MRAVATVVLVLATTTAHAMPPAQHVALAETIVPPAIIDYLTPVFADYLTPYIDSSDSLASTPTVTPAAQVLLPTTNGARCLDGSPPSIYVSKGAEKGKWLIFLQGGAWCTSYQDCCERAMTDLGSSSQSTGHGPRNLADEGRYLRRDPALNPLFHNWSYAFPQYCDGGSFAGAASTPLVGVCKSPGAPKALHFAGSRNLDASIEYLKSKHGLERASEVVVGGCSAGGLAAILHVDRFAEALPAVPRLVGMADSGFFLDSDLAAHPPDFSLTDPAGVTAPVLPDVKAPVLAGVTAPVLAGVMAPVLAAEQVAHQRRQKLDALRRRRSAANDARRRRTASLPPGTLPALAEDGIALFPGYYTSQLNWTFATMNATAGLDKDCIAHYRNPASAGAKTGQTWRCMFAQYAVQHTKTPMIFFQSAYDQWQTSANDGGMAGPVNSTAVVNDFGGHMRSILKSALQASPQHAAFIDGCSRHCQKKIHDDSEDFCLWSAISIDGVTQSTALANFLRPPSSALSGLQLGMDARVWEHTNPYPCPECCTGGGLGARKAKDPKAEAPKAEAPKAEAPKAEAPKAEAPKTEAEKAAMWKAQAEKAAAEMAAAWKAEKTEAEKAATWKALAEKAQAEAVAAWKAEKAEAKKATMWKKEAMQAEAKMAKADLIAALRDSEAAAEAEDVRQDEAFDLMAISPSSSPMAMSP